MQNCLLGLWLVGTLCTAFLSATPSELFLLTFFAAFVAYFVILKKNIPHLFYWGLLVRIVLCFIPPFWHEYWYLLPLSGENLSNGVNPYLITNEVLFARIPFYPPLVQWLLWFSSKFQEPNMFAVLLKVMVLLGEIGVYWMLSKITKRFNVSANNIALYWLNPLVVLCLLGGIYFEGIALFFILYACYSFASLKDQNGAFNMAFALLSNMLSILILPLLLFKAGWKRGLKTVLIVVLLVCFCYFPFFSQGQQSQVLEYFLLIIKQSNITIVTFLLIVLISYLYRFRNRLSLFTGMLLIQATYLLFLPHLQPWNIVLLMGFCVFTNYRFPILWSLLLVLYYSPMFDVQLLQHIQLAALWLVLIWEIKAHFNYKKFRAALST